VPDPAYSFVTNRGRGCKQAAKYGGWLDKNGAASTYPVHGKVYYVLIQQIVGIADLRTVKTCATTGITLTPQGFGYAPIAIDRNLTNFPVTVDDVNSEARTAMPYASWIPSGGSIVGSYMAECDGNPFVSPPGDVNIISLFDLDGIQTRTAPDPFNVKDLSNADVHPSGEV